MELRMSRTGRMFQLMDALRGNRHPVTAAALAERLGVSERTIYRDLQSLAELGALVLGARWVRGQGDMALALAAAASGALAKIATIDSMAPGISAGEYASCVNWRTEHSGSH
jgi:predicted DNA-binding transcriptional regulator YafY